MPTHSLSPQALAVIDSYEHLKIGNKTINCPYFNNRTTNLRGALRVLVGKGTPLEIADEARILSLRDKFELDELHEDDLVKFLTEHHLGLDCAAFAYYILDAELQSTQNKKLRQLLSFKSKGLLRRLIAKFRIVENTGVLVFNENSNEIKLEEIKPGDAVIALGGGIRHDYNHIIIITSVTRDDSEKVQSLEYAHSYTWKSEGKYTKGIRRGTIEITKPNGTILEQKWTEDGKTGEKNETWTYLKNAGSVRLTSLNI
ncbi:MAG: hypothetical protein KBD29_03195 [Candidatus Magasanikbacteria bacterium]|nr:hypothetical protein [Candidatus Magasanikbacteria bacterium]